VCDTTFCVLKQNKKEHITKILWGGGGGGGGVNSNTT